jgi:hypothetical protein
MTNNQILVFDNPREGLASINPPEMNGAFNYAISHNLQEAKRIAVNIREAIKDSKEMEEYRKKLQSLQEEHAVKDKDGKPEFIRTKIPNGAELIQYNIPSALDPESEFNVKLKELNEEYREHVEKQNERLKMLNQENEEFEPMYIKPGDIPKGLSREEMDLIFPLIKKDE